MFHFIFHKYFNIKTNGLKPFHKLKGEITAIVKHSESVWKLTIHSFLLSHAWTESTEALLIFTIPCCHNHVVNDQISDGQRAGSLFPLVTGITVRCFAGPHGRCRHDWTIIRKTGSSKRVPVTKGVWPCWHV